MGSLAESPFLGFRVEYQRELGKRGNEVGGGYECSTGIYLLGEAYSEAEPYHTELIRFLAVGVAERNDRATPREARYTVFACERLDES